MDQYPTPGFKDNQFGRVVFTDMDTLDITVDWPQSSELHHLRILDTRSLVMVL
jgi:hypothetical protein